MNHINNDITPGQQVSNDSQEEDIESEQKFNESKREKLDNAAKA